MSNYLIEHAAQNAWCSPDQDRQVIIQPARISREEGAWNKMNIVMKTIELPTHADRFHVFQIGQIFPALLGLLPYKNTWTRFTDCCEAEKMSMDLYSDKGIRYPNYLAWYIYTNDRNILIAIQDEKKIPISLTKEPIYLRLYSNAYFASQRSAQIDDIVKNEGQVVADYAAIMNFQYKIAVLRNKPGMTYRFVNGYYVNEVSPLTAKPGDVVEYFHDGSIEKIVDFPVNQLPMFESTLDGRRKYLLHCPKGTSNEIRYFDDNDIYLVQTLPGNNLQGVLYHRNQGLDAVRQLTHQDYSIQVPYVVALNDGIPNSTDPEQLTVRLYLRKSGYSRPLVFDSNRLQELYKLSDTNIIRALVGIDATIANWDASHLEASAYVGVMNYPKRELPISLVEQAYGYNAISKLLGDTPSFAQVSNQATTSGLKVIDLLPSLQTNSVVFEYGPNGQLLSWRNHDIGNVYPCEHQQTRLAEVLSGSAGFELDDFWGTQLTLDPKANYRFYLSPILNGVKQNQWVDVTGSSSYAIQNGVAIWLVSATEYECLIRSDKKILAFDLTLPMLEGIFRFPIQQIQTKDGVTAARNLDVPPGELDIYLNKKPLIKDIDYAYAFPNITIWNKEYLIDPLNTAQLITVRAKGFCTQELELDPEEDAGFVCFGKLSMNKRFDLRDDRVMRIVVDGSLKDRTDFQYGEEDDGVSVGDVPNGRPYMIRDIVVPTKGQTVASTTALRQIAQVTDQAVADYLSLKHPEVERTDTFTIEERYQIYSPFFSKILWDMKLGVIQDDRLIEKYGDGVVRELCKPYEYLLKDDPCHDDRHPDSRFVSIHPTPLFSVMDVNAYTYGFMTRVAKIYLQDRVNLSAFLRIVV